MKKRIFHVFLIVITAYLSYQYPFRQTEPDHIPWGSEANNLRKSLHVPLIEEDMVFRDSLRWEMLEDEPSDHHAIHVYKSVVPYEQTILNYEMDAFRIRDKDGRIQQLNVYSTIVGDSTVVRDGRLFYRASVHSTKLDHHGIDSIARLWGLDDLIIGD